MIKVSSLFQKKVSCYEQRDIVMNFFLVKFRVHKSQKMYINKKPY